MEVVPSRARDKPREVSRVQPQLAGRKLRVHVIESSGDVGFAVTRGLLIGRHPLKNLLDQVLGSGSGDVPIAQQATEHGSSSGSEPVKKRFGIEVQGLSLKRGRCDQRKREGDERTHGPG